MKAPWHLRRPKLLAEVRADVQGFAHSLIVFVEGDIVRIRGAFPVLFAGDDLGRYAIEVEFPSDYPDHLPVVREVGGRIPWLGKYHVFTDGTACVLLPEHRWWVFPPGRRFLDYLKGPLHNYFLSQIVVAGGGEWPFGEHDHGLAGVINFYAERLGTNEPKVIVGILEAVAHGRARGHLPCPCGKGPRMRKCHPQVLALARTMPAWAARESLDRIFNLARKETDQGRKR